MIISSLRNICKFPKIVRKKINELAVRKLISVSICRGTKYNSIVNVFVIQFSLFLRYQIVDETMVYSRPHSSVIYHDIISCRVIFNNLLPIVKNIHKGLFGITHYIKFEMFIFLVYLSLSEKKTSPCFSK